MIWGFWASLKSTILGWNFCLLTLFRSYVSPGNPKGAMITHRNVVSDCSAFVKMTEVNFWERAIFPCFQWLASGLKNEGGHGPTIMLGLDCIRSSTWNRDKVWAFTGSEVTFSQIVFHYGPDPQLLLWPLTWIDRSNLLHLLYSKTSFEYCLINVFGEGNSNPLQYSCLENPMNRGAWWATVHRVTKSWTWLSNFTFTL